MPVLRTYSCEVGSSSSESYDILRTFLIPMSSCSCRILTFTGNATGLRIQQATYSNFSFPPFSSPTSLKSKPFNNSGIALVIPSILMFLPIQFLVPSPKGMQHLCICASVSLSTSSQRSGAESSSVCAKYRSIEMHDPRAHTGYGFCWEIVPAYLRTAFRHDSLEWQAALRIQTHRFL